MPVRTRPLHGFGNLALVPETLEPGNSSRPHLRPDDPLMSDSVKPHDPPKTTAAPSWDPEIETGVHHGSEGVMSLSFLGLMFTQFLGAMNDNIFRWLAVWIGKEMAGPQYASAAVSAGLALLVLPFIVFAAPAGYLGDRFSKRDVIIGCKIAEVVVMALGVGAILYGNIYVLFAVLFLMGTQSALFGPSKYGAIPEIVRPDRISIANGLIGMTTIMAIVVGTVTAGYVYYWTGPVGVTKWWISASVLLGVAGTGLLTSLMIRRLPVASPERRFPINIPGETYRNMAALVAIRPLILAALGSAVFWGLGALCQVNVERLATGDLSLMPKDTGPLLAVLALGVGVGNVLAGVCSRGRIELGIVPYGAAGIALFAALLTCTPGGAVLADGNANYLSASYLLICLLLLMLGMSAGAYDVPLLAFLQERSPRKTRGSILAACNFLTCTAMFAASGVFLLLTNLANLSDGAVPNLSGRAIFLVLGLSIVPVAILAAYLLPVPTLRVLLLTVRNLMYRVRIEGEENIPAEGGAMITPNHVSWADGLLIALAVPRRIRMVAYADYFDIPGIAWFGRVTGVIPITPGKRSIVQSLRTARQALNDGDLVCIFPEGALTRDGNMGEFHPGFMMALKKTDAPVIPVYVTGMWGSIFSFERGRCFWKIPKRLWGRVTIRFGRPIYHPENVDEVRNAVRELGGLPPESTGNGKKGFNENGKNGV